MDEANQIPQSRPPQKSVGGAIGIIIIVILLIVGALYFWGARLNQDTPEIPVIEETVPLSESDSVDDIIADLDATDLGDIEADLNEIELDIDSALAE